jgi:hypothetical protein
VQVLISFVLALDNIRNKSLVVCSRLKGKMSALTVHISPRLVVYSTVSQTVEQDLTKILVLKNDLKYGCIYIQFRQVSMSYLL